MIRFLPEYEDGAIIIQALSKENPPYGVNLNFFRLMMDSQMVDVTGH